MKSRSHIQNCRRLSDYVRGMKGLGCKSQHSCMCMCVCVCRLRRNWVANILVGFPIWFSRSRLQKIDFTIRKVMRLLFGCQCCIWCHLCCIVSCVLSLPFVCCYVNGNKYENEYANRMNNCILYRFDGKKYCCLFALAATCCKLCSRVNWNLEKAIKREILF